MGIYEIIRYGKFNLEKKKKSENILLENSIKLSIIGQKLSGKKSLALKWAHNL